MQTTVDTTDEKPKIIASAAAGAMSASFDKKKRKQDGFKMSGGERGGGSGGRRRKRWRPEEIDPMIAAEDAEIKRLERLLGIAGPNAKKKRAKLDRELEQEDGLGDEFGAFLAGLDHMGEIVEGDASGSSNDVDADWDFHENVVGGSSSGSSGEGDERDERSVRGIEKRQRGRGEANSEGALVSDDEIGDRDEDNTDDSEEEREKEEHEGREGGGNNGNVIGRDGAHAAQHRLKDTEDESKKERDESSEPGDEERGKVSEDELEEEEEEDEEYDEEEEEDYDDVERDDDFDDDEEENDGDKESTYDDEEGDVVGVGRQEKIEERKGRREEGMDGAGENRTESCDKDNDDGEGDEKREEGEDFRLHAYRPTPGQDIYGRPVGKGDVGPAPAKYVPPHLRVAAAAAGEAEVCKRQEVQRNVNGIMNRLSEDTLEPVAARLKDAYRAYSTTIVNEALWQATRAVCVHPKQVMSTLIPPFAAVIAALNISLGADVGGFFLETIARELNAEVWGATRTGSRGTCLNLALLLAYLYNYGVAHCSLVYDIIRLLVQAFGPTEMELLLVLLQHSGYQLRSDDPQALQQIVAIVKDRSVAAATVTASAASTSSFPPADVDNTKYLAEDAGRWKAAFGSGASSSDPANIPLVGQGQASDYETSVAPGSDPAVVGTSRSRYILDTIVELQGNKRSRIREQGQEYGRRLRKWLGSVKAAKAAGGGSGGTGGDASLRVSWAELVSTESRGRWWKVGAAWAGRGSTSGNGAGQEKTGMVADSSDGDDVTARASDVADGDEGVGLLTLAARQRMNTDVRRSVFVAIMGSLDCEDALEKILRLNLKGVQEREIARVIIECCSQECSYNPFYAHLAERVCDRQPKLRFTFQVAFWDALKTLDERAARRAGSLARLMAHLVLQKQLSLTILKTVEVPELTSSGLLLVRIFFQEIIAAGDDAAFMEVFRRLARPPGEKGNGHATARDNTLVFLRGHLGSAPVSWDRDKKRTFRKRVKGACRLIEAIVTAEELG